MQYRILKKRHGKYIKFHPQKRFTILGIGIGKWKDMTDAPMRYIESAKSVMRLNNVSLDKVKYEIE